MGSDPGDVKRREYDNAGRRARSDEHRERILEAARSSFVAHGYRSTTIARIARSAGVHPDTVYELVGRKPVLLRELIERAISGTDRAVVGEQRDYVIEMRAEPDPARKLAIYAGAIRRIHARMAPLLTALRDAASTETEAAEVWREISDRRAANMRKLVGDLADAGGLRADLPVDVAADVIWVTSSAEQYLMLTVERGWDPGRYEGWLADLWVRYLLPDAPR